MRRAGAIVEVAGIDGSGKSTLASHLAGQLIRRGTTTYVRSLHSWSRRWAMARAASQGLTREAYVGQDAIEFAAAVEIMNRARHLEHAVRDGSVVVLDPYIYCAAAVAASYDVPNLHAVVDTYLEAATPDVVGYLDISEEIALDRLRARTDADNILANKHAEPSLKQFLWGFTRIRPAFEDAGIRIVDLDAEAGIEENVRAVVGVLNEFVDDASD